MLGDLFERIPSFWLCRSLASSPVRVKNVPSDFLRLAPTRFPGNHFPPCPYYKRTANRITRIAARSLSCLLHGEHTRKRTGRSPRCSAWACCSAWRPLWRKQPAPWDKTGKTTGMEPTTAPTKTRIPMGPPRRPPPPARTKQNRRRKPRYPLLWIPGPAAHSNRLRPAKP